MLKVFLVIGLSGGRKKTKQKPLCWSLLWKLSYCLIQMFSKLKSWFFKCKNRSCFPLISWCMQWKAALFKDMLEIKRRESNGSGNRYLQGLEISPLVWQFDLSRHALIFLLTLPKILVVHHVLEHNSEVFSWEDCISHMWSISWNTGYAVFLTLLWLGAVRSDLKFHALTFLHVKNLSSFGFAMESCAM